MRTFEVTVINWKGPGCKSESANLKVYTQTHQLTSSGSSNEIKMV